MEPIYFHPYDLKTARPLNSRSERRVISGALLRQGDGFGCLQPWPELGDSPLAEHLQLLTAGEQSPMVQRALECCAVDGEARRAGVNLFAHLRVPQSHATLVGFPGLPDLEALSAAGFTVVKIKISNKELPLLATWNSVPLRIRLDANATLMPEEFLLGMEALSDEVRNAIDFVEDPCAYDAKIWDFLRAKCGVELALDRGCGEIGYGVRVWKPAVTVRPDWIGRLIATSNMDHAVGQMFAAYEAARCGISEICGLLTHGLFEENDFSDTIQSIGPQLHPPSGTGLGFDTLLEGLPWKRFV